jgi:hypothetical protein
MANNRMKYIVDGISSIKGQKAAPASGDYPAKTPKVTFRGAFVNDEYDDELGFTVGKENNIEFKIDCTDNEIKKLGSLLEAIKKMQSGGKKIELEFDGAIPSYGDYKTVYSVVVDATASDFIKKFEPLLK